MVMRGECSGENGCNQKVYASKASKASKTLKKVVSRAHAQTLRFRAQASRFAAQTLRFLLQTRLTVNYQLSIINC